jgi:hypothetical protein
MRGLYLRGAYFFPSPDTCIILADNPRWWWDIFGPWLWIRRGLTRVVGGHGPLGRVVPPMGQQDVHGGYYRVVVVVLLLLLLSVVNIREVCLFLPTGPW